MIFHILKKDWKLLWPLVAIGAFAHAIAAMLWWLRDHGAQPDDILKPLSQLFPLVALLGSAILCIAAVHTDPIPGDCDDWLTRPISRHDMLTAKLLFVLLAVVAPVVLISAGEALLDGFQFVASISAASGRGVALLILICLPALVLGAITRNAVEAIMAAVVAGVLAVLLVLIFNLFGRHPTLNNSGLTWLGAVEFSGAVIAGALLILPLQYSHRSTAASRLLVVPFFLLALQFQTMPWNLVFSGQQLFGSDKATDHEVAIGFDPSVGRSPRTAIDAGVTGHASVVNLPVRVEGVAAGNVLLVDQVGIRLIADGKVIYHQDSAETSYSIPAFSNLKTQFRQEGASGRSILGYQLILLPVPVLNRVRSGNLTFEMDYSLSLFRKDATATIAAVGDSKQLEKIGWCKTHVDDDGDEAEIDCVQLGQAPNCLSAVLENPATKQHDPGKFVCAPDYSPIPIHFVPDALAHFGLGIKFADIGNASSYPVSESQLGTARMNLTEYQPISHFTRHVVIPNIRLGDWEAGPGL